MSVALLLSVSLSVAAAAPAKDLTAAAAMQASLQKQRESIQKQRDSLNRQPAVKPQAVSASTDFITPIPPMVQADCQPLPRDEAENLISSAAQKQSMDPAVLRAVMRQESGFRPCAVSNKGAQGLMQLMPETAAQLRVSDPFDPRQNVEGGAAFLRQLLDRYKGDLRLALVAYNAGANRADNLDPQSYPAETQHYIANIFGELGIPLSDGPAADNSGTEQTSETASDNQAAPEKQSAPEKQTPPDKQTSSDNKPPASPPSP